MEQLSITRFTQATQPFAGHFKTLQPMRKVPKVKRPVGRPHKRPYDDPETQVQQTQDRAEIGLTSQNDVTPSPKRIRAAYSLEKKKEVVEYALSHSIYQACKHFNLSTGTVWPWMKMDFAKEKTVVYRAAGGGRKLSYPTEIEEELVKWVLEQQDLHLAVSVGNIID